MKDRPPTKNIILIITDTYRWDNLFDRAERPLRTPYLDGFASGRATSVEGFYSGSFPTIPHRTDLTTGRLGWPHYGWQALAKSSANHIPQLLKGAGYETQLLCDCPHLFKAGFDSGFDAALQTRGQEGDCQWLHLNDPVVELMSPHKTRVDRRGTAGPGARVKDHTLSAVHRWNNGLFRHEDDTFAARTARLARHWLEENYRSTRPFFLWVDFFDPHEPWDPPEYLVRHYDPDYEGVPMVHPNYGPASAYSAAELTNLWAHYAAEATVVDRAVGSVLTTIEETGLMDDSIVCITSDHGFSVGDHDRAGKTNIHPTSTDRWPLYPEVAHVPFLLAGSNVPAGSSLNLIAQPIDILPTLCDLAEVTVDPPEPVQGRSFAAAVHEKRGTHRDCAVSGSFFRAGTDSIGPRATTPVIYTDRWAYVPAGVEGPELYDLRTDPFAKSNVVHVEPEVAHDLHRRFMEHLHEFDAPKSMLGLFESGLAT
jgi:arylsulfatase A-like enzyme